MLLTIIWWLTVVAGVVIWAVLRLAYQLNWSPVVK
jgi:hypothetical protein